MFLLLLLLVACGDSWTDEQIANAQNVARAMKLEQEAVMISNRIGPGFDLPLSFSSTRS